MKIDQIKVGNIVKFRYHVAKLNIEISGDGAIRRIKGAFVYVFDGTAVYEMGAASIRRIITCL